MKIPARFRRYGVAASALLGLLIQTAFAENPDITDAGDVLRYAMPALAVGSTFVANGPDGGWFDREGFYQTAKSQVSTAITQAVWKETAEAYRPDFGSQDSFPSGHTAAACSAGDFLTTRYWNSRLNWLWAFIGQGGCLFTAYSRIQADAHFINDVTASYGLAWMYNQLYVTPKRMRNGVSVMPMVLDGVPGGITISVAEASDKPSAARRRYEQQNTTRWRFSMVWGTAYMEKNEITSPRKVGTTFDLNTFQKINDPFHTSILGLYYDWNERHSIYTEFLPLEARDIGTFSTPVRFDNTVFPANEQILSSWRQNEFRFGWSYDFNPRGRWITRAGVELEILHLTVSLENGSVGKQRVEEFYALPLVSGNLGYRITPKLALQTTAEGLWLSDDSLLDIAAFFTYRATRRWEWSLGYRYYEREMSKSELESNFAYQMPFLNVSYLW